MKARHRVGNARFECPVLQCPFKATRRDNVAQHVKNIHGISSKDLSQKKQLGEGRQTTLINNGDNAEASPGYNWLDLMEAASTGDLVVLQKVLNAGVYIDSQADDGRTALHCAARAGQDEVARAILELETPCWSQKSDFFWCSVLQEAILGKSLGCCQFLLGSPVIKDSITRVMTGLVEIFSDRLRKTELKSNEVWTHVANLAILATRSNDRGIVESILESFSIEPVGVQHEEDIIISIRQFLARIMAVDAAKRSLIGILEMLRVRCSAALWPTPKYHNCPLHAAIVRNQAACVRWLLRHTRGNDYRRSSAFQKAVKLGFKTIVEIFLEAESNFRPDLRNRFGRAALHDAVKNGDTEIVQVLVDFASTDINITTNNRRRTCDTALHLAVGVRNLDIVKVLVRCERTDVSLKNGQGQTALCLATSDGLVDIATVLLEHGARDDRALFQAFSDWDAGMLVAQVIVRYLERDTGTTFDETKIQTRAHLGEYLFKMKGYRYEDVYTTRNVGPTYLIPIAVKERDIDLLLLLLGLDSITADDLNEKMCNLRSRICYRTPLNYARSRDYTDIADLLSASGAVNEIYDPFGELVAEERMDALRLAAKDDESTQSAQEQPLSSDLSRQTPVVPSREEFGSEIELEEEPDSYIDKYIDLQSSEAEESEKESKRQRRE